jgi:hypothetical protein
MTNLTSRSGPTLWSSTRQLDTRHPARKASERQPSGWRGGQAQAWPSEIGPLDVSVCHLNDDQVGPDRAEALSLRMESLRTEPMLHQGGIANAG